MKLKMKLENLSNYILKYVLLDSETDIIQCDACGYEMPSMEIGNEIKRRQICMFCDTYHCESCFDFLHRCAECRNYYGYLYMHRNETDSEYQVCYDCFIEVYGEDELDNAIKLTCGV